MKAQKLFFYYKIFKEKTDTAFYRSQMGRLKTCGLTTVKVNFLKKYGTFCKKFAKYFQAETEKGTFSSL